MARISAHARAVTRAAAVALVATAALALASSGGVTVRAQGFDELARAPWFQVVNNDESGTFDLFVGRLDGPPFPIVRAPTAIQASGPVFGRVLAWWDDDSGTHVIRADANEGTFQEIPLPPGQRLLSASVRPGNDAEVWYFVGASDDGSADGLWQMSLFGGEATRLADAWPGYAAYQTWATDGSLLAIWDRGESGVEYRIYDPSTRELRTLDIGNHGDVVGIMDDSLIVYDDPSADTELHFPLDAAGLREELFGPIVEGTGIFADVFASNAGDALVYDGPGPDGQYALSAVGSEISQEQPFFTGEGPWYDPPLLMMRHTAEANVELPPDWVPVLADQAVYSPQGDGQRLLVDVASGARITCSVEGCHD